MRVAKGDDCRKCYMCRLTSFNEIALRDLDRLFWGLFVIGVGILLLLERPYALDLKLWLVFLAGLLLLLLNLARLLSKSKVSEVSLYLGVILLSYWYILKSGLEVNILVILLILIGIYLIVSAIRRR